MASDLPVHVFLASLARGGAERIVCETLTTLHAEGFRADLFLLSNSKAPYELPMSDRLQIVKPSGNRQETLQSVATRILDSGSNLVLTHLIPSEELKVLWRSGVRTVPVIHNSSLGWQEEPSVFAHPLVPFVVAISSAVARELRDARCTKPVIVVRHELQQWFDSAEMEQDRQRIRTKYRISDREFVVGMVGNFKAQKAYPRAIRVLDRLRRLGPVRFLILGSWGHAYGYGNRTYEATCQLAQKLGVEQHLILPGSVPDVKPYYAAFDAFLSTSIYEGLSIAMLEAQKAGCPIVTADVGGNSECLGPESHIVHNPSDIDEYVEALTSVGSYRAPPVRKLPYPSLIPRLWRQLATYSTPVCGDRVLFVTDSVNNSGATHSLINLLTRFRKKEQVALCILGSVHNTGLLNSLQKAAIRVLEFPAPAGVIDCADRVLESLRTCFAGTLCFWNVDSSVKLLVTKVLSASAMKIVDVSPGPCLFEQLAVSANFQHRIAFTATDYFARLDRFVAKYSGGVPAPEYNVLASKVSVIRNGVPCHAEHERACLPAGFSEAFRLITCCRLVPQKRLELVIDSAAEVAKHLPETSLTVVGDAEQAESNYAETLARRAGSRAFHNTWFPGLQPRVTPYLNAARVFVTASAVEGCSNAVLEAMSAGLPVVGTWNAAIAEQVRDGVTGFVVNPKGAAPLADKISLLLRDPEMAHGFGEAGRRLALEEFGIDRMVNDYARILGCN
jgi:glycosyltransferase involved in cell wall biosynthesis